MYVDASLGLEALGILSLLQVPPTRELGENTQGVSTIFKYMRVCVSRYPCMRTETRRCLAEKCHFLH